MKTISAKKNRNGNTFIEVTIIVTVIALLAVISVFSYRGGDGVARLAQAEADIEALVAAEIAVAEEYGIYVPLQMLDDSKAIDDAPGERRDSFMRESTDLLAIDMHARADSQIGNQEKVSERIIEWNGPYHSSKRIYVGGTLDQLPRVERLSDDAIQRDWPLDPWGNPYRFYSPIGVIGTRAMESDEEALASQEFSDGALTTEDLRFETFAIVSFGPDGLSDSVSDTSDDVIYLFETDTDEESDRS